MINEQVRKLWRRRAIHPTGSGKVYRRRLNLDRYGKRLHSGMHGVWEDNEIFELGTMVWDRKWRDWFFLRDGFREGVDAYCIAPCEYNHMNRIAVYQHFSADA